MPSYNFDESQRLAYKSIRDSFTDATNMHELGMAVIASEQIVRSNKLDKYQQERLSEHGKRCFFNLKREEETYAYELNTNKKNNN